MKVSKVMHSGVTFVEPGTHLGDIAKKMREQDIGAIPVCEDSKYLGMITDRDIVCRGLADGRDPAKLQARDVMSKGVVSCHESDELSSAIETMTRKHVRRLAVLDDKQHMVGMLSLGDICHKTDAPHCAGVMQAVASHHA